MHLKALTLKGFKSFASPTTLRFEPGITCVVGPNGSGKSNVVDALAWVMGEQGAKSLRGGTMEDVIFAGTAGRAPLGRAEVSLTIDNTDGALPIEYAEVTITRLMFRTGGSEYSINGAPARLLDVQELLSDSGIGRQMHVIVGQGQLDAVLAASPEERRGFIEEAAGVLKHRKRKEKALRKLDATAGNLTRLGDLLTELRRQLRPLGRQAEVARRAGIVAAEARDASLRLLADDLTSLTAARQDLDEAAATAHARRAGLTVALQTTTASLEQTQARAQEANPAVAAAQETWYQLSAIRERLAGTAHLADERMRHVDSVVDTSGPGLDLQTLVGQAEQVRAESAAGEQALGQARVALERAIAAREAAEEAAAAEERRVRAALAALADRREGLARLAGAVSGRRMAVARGVDELERLAGVTEAADQAALAAGADRELLQGQVAQLDATEVTLDTDYEGAAERARSLRTTLDELTDAVRAGEQERTALLARQEALQLSLVRRDGDRVLLDNPPPGVVGALSGIVRVRAGYEGAVSAALGPFADAVVVTSVSDAIDALRLLRDRDAGRARLVIAGSGPARGRPWVETGATPGRDGPARLLDLVQAPETVLTAMTQLVGDVVVVDDLDSAARVLADGAPGRVVTRAGDLLSTSHADGGSDSAPSLLAAQAAADETAARLSELVTELDELRERRAAQEAQCQAADRAVAAALEQLNASDARLSALAEQLAERAARARAADAERDRARARLADAAAAVARDQAALAELEQRLAAAESAGDQTEPSTDERDRLAEAARVARADETEARLALRTEEERASATAERVARAEVAVHVRREELARAADRRARLARQASIARAVRAAVDRVLPRLEESAARAAEQRAAASAAQALAERELVGLRAVAREQAAELEVLQEALHQDELARAQLQMRIEAVIGRATEEHGVGPEVLLAEYGPQVRVPPTTSGQHEDGGAGPGEPRPFLRAEQERRLRAAERGLAELGKVNPLALEEFAALQERATFLSRQMEDLQATRRDLLEIVKDVDQRVQQVFVEAFEDTDRAFRSVFARLFPGGDGRLVLTAPDDLLATGVDVEARPPGKRVKRLSLLSGGERSLTALALLLAIFTARPSPFYVLDEAEAALDDVNLGRLLGLLEELRASSQLIVVTHQKRTMEIADALYGVAMRGDGVTTVISQRLRDAEAV